MADASKHCGLARQAAKGMFARAIARELEAQKLIDATGLAAKWARLEAADLIDWPAAATNKLALLRRLFDEFSAGLEHDRRGTLARDFARFRQGGGDLLEQHARFEVLHAARLATDRDAWSWRNWPAHGTCDTMRWCLHDLLAHPAGELRTNVPRDLEDDGFDVDSRAGPSASGLVGQIPGQSRY